MKKVLKWTVIVLVALFLLFKFVAQPYLLKQTKKHSPEMTVTHTYQGNDMEVFYCAPYKKDREIFGGLVPYGQEWRTGANEPTTFSTSKDITIHGKTLKAGKYTVWTIPDKNEWTVIFNDKMYDWGVTLMSGGKKTPREPDHDALQIKVPVQTLPTTVEQFTMGFEETDGIALTLAWDTTKVSVPLQ